MNLIGRLQLSTEKTKQEENDGIVALRILRIQVRYYIFYLASCRLSLHSFTTQVSSELYIRNLPSNSVNEQIFVEEKERTI